MHKAKTFGWFDASFDGNHNSKTGKLEKCGKAETASDGNCPTSSKSDDRENAFPPKLKRSNTNVPKSAKGSHKHIEPKNTESEVKILFSKSSKMLSPQKRKHHPSQQITRQQNVTVHRSKTKINCQTVWVDKHSPKTREDLAVHPKKLEKLDQILREIPKTNSIILLKGPPGCGKSISFRILSKEHNFEVIEWKNSTDLNVLQGKPLFDDQIPVKTDVYAPSQTVQFRNFLQELRFCSIPTAGSMRDSIKVALIDDLPNVFFRDPTVLEDCLRSYRTKVPLVFVLTEASGGSFGDFSVNRLFPQRLIEDLHIRVVEFNPCANTFLIRALSKVTDSEGLTSKHIKDKLRNIADCAHGDIRAAVNLLQANCSEGEIKNVSSCRDAQLELFHALGKVLYAKRQEETASTNQEDTVFPTHLSRDLRRRPLAFNLEEVLERSGCSHGVFAQFLHENYIGHCSSNSVDIVSQVLDDLSSVEGSTRDWTASDLKDSYCAEVFTRSYAFHKFSQTNAPPNQFRQIRRPLAKDTDRRRASLCADIRSAFAARAESTWRLARDVLPYARHISDVMEFDSELQVNTVKSLLRWDGRQQGLDKGVKGLKKMIEKTCDQTDERSGQTNVDWHIEAAFSSDEEQ